MSDEQKTPEQIEAEEAAAKRAKEAEREAKFIEGKEKFRIDIAKSLGDRAQMLRERSDAAMSAWGDSSGLAHESDVLEATLSAMEQSALVAIALSAKIGILLDFVATAYPADKQGSVKRALTDLMAVTDEETTKLQETWRA